VRHAFEDTLEARFSGAVEEQTGRKVVGFLSQVAKDPVYAVEAFRPRPRRTDRSDRDFGRIAFAFRNVKRADFSASDFDSAGISRHEIFWRPGPGVPAFSTTT
jgi:hypothetical protein